MLRALVVTATLLAAPAAHADRACAPATAYLPLPDTTVPTNAKLWSFRGAAPALSLDGAPVPLDARRASDDTTRLDPGELRPRTRYTYADGSGFWTGSDPDVEPPPTPDVRTIAIHEAGGQVDVRLDARLSGDAALLRVTFFVGMRSVTFVTLPDGIAGLGKPACGTMLPVRAGDEVVVAIAALDLAGNESDKVERDVTVLAAMTPAGASCGTTPYLPPRQNLALGLLLMFGGALAGLVALALGVAMLVDLFQRVPASARGAVPLSLVVVERIARRTRQLGGMYALVLGAVAVALARVDAPIIGGIVAAFASVGIVTAVRAARVVRVIAGGDAASELIGAVAIVHGRTGLASLAISSQELAAARDLVVPACIVYK